MYALDDARVLRRYRERDVSEREILAMEHARRHRYPVPVCSSGSGSGHLCPVTRELRNHGTGDERDAHAHETAGDDSDLG